MVSPAILLKSALFLLVTLVLGPVYLIALLVFYPRRLQLGPQLVRLYSRICLRIFHVTLGRITHLHAFRAIKGKVLIVANHVSFLDIFVISAVFGAAFVSKEEVRRYPVIGPIARLMGCIFFDRGSSLERLRLLRTVAEGDAARVLAVFPQGTTGRSAGRLPFHRGIFKVTELNPAITMLPVTLFYKEEDAVAWVRPQSLRDNARRVGGETRIHVKVIVHDPVTIEDYRGKTAEAICRMVEETVMDPLAGEYGKPQ